MNLCNWLSDEYATDVKTFFQVAKNHMDQNRKTRIHVNIVRMHFGNPYMILKPSYIYKYRIATTYQRWIFHGENFFVEYNERKDMSGTNRLDHNEIFTINDDVDEDDKMIELLSDVYGPIPNRDATSKTTNVETKHFNELLGEVGKKVFIGSKLSFLTFIVKLMHLRVLNR